MPALRATRAYRADAPARARRSKSPCTLGPSSTGETLDISFDLALQRGAKSRVVVAMGKADLSRLIEEAISLWPELGPVLAGKAAGTLATLLERQRTFPGTVAARALKRLEQVDHHLDALAEEALPRRAMRQVIAAGNALEEARGTLEAL